MWDVGHAGAPPAQAGGPASCQCALCCRGANFRCPGPAASPPMQEAIHAAFQRRGAAQDKLLQEQAALAAVVQAAAAALEQHGATVAGGGPQPLTAEQLAALATPAGSAGREAPRRDALLDSSAEAEALEQLLEDGWLGRSAAAAAARELDCGEQAVSYKEGGEEEAAAEGVGESGGPH